VVFDCNLDTVLLVQSAQLELYWMAAISITQGVVYQKIQNQQQGIGIEAHNAGVDDYLIKPFSIDELMARLRAMHRRMAAFASQSEGSSGQTDVLQIADLSMNTRTRDVRRGEKSIHLSVKEYDLLNFLMRRSDRVLERQEIMRGVWGENFFGDDNLLDVYIRYLRQKIEIDSNLTLIHTIRGVGFMLRAQAAT